MKHLSQIALIMMLTILCYKVNGQGCSDAGFCTIINPPPAVDDSLNTTSEKNKINLSALYGKGDFNINIFSASIAYRRTLSEKFAIDGKLGFQSTDGELGKASGVNDAYLSFLYNSVKASHTSTVLLGIKIPVSDASETDNTAPLPDGISLPMPYQPGQGTWDIIAGYEYGWKNFSLSAGLQLPVNNGNKNNFLPPSYMFLEMLADKYLPTNEFERKADVLLRAKYSLQPKKGRLTFTGGILPIYHLEDDSYADAAGVRHEITGSKGLTLNLNLFVQYDINGKSNLVLTLAAPAVTRESRPDGLTREFVAALDYNFKF